LSTSTSPAAPARFARSAFEANVQWPRDARAMTPARLPAGSDDLLSLFGSLSRGYQYAMVEPSGEKTGLFSNVEVA
jgi:hypothetical protein